LEFLVECKLVYESYEAISVEASAVTTKVGTLNASEWTSLHLANDRAFRVSCFVNQVIRVSRSFKG